MPNTRIAIFEEACAGGTGRHVADLAACLAQDGYDVHLLHSSKHIDDRFRIGIEQVKEAGGQVVALDIHHYPHWTDAVFCAQVKLYLFQNGPFDIFHCHSTKAGLVGRLAAAGLGIPVLYTPNAFLTMSPTSGKLMRFGAAAMEKALSWISDTVICVSEEEKNHAIRLGIHPRKLNVIPNGIVLDDARVQQSSRATVRGELGLVDNDVCIGSVGRLVDQKDPKMLIQAFGLAADRLTPNVKLVMVGEGLLLDQLQSAVAEMHIEDRVLFTGKKYGLRMMSAFDVFALSSSFEGHPYVFIEALALGLPILTTQVGGASASVIDGKNGFRSPVGDPITMAENIVKLARSPHLRMAMSEWSRALSTKFSLSNMVRDTDSLYASLMPGSKKQRTTGTKARANSA